MNRFCVLFIVFGHKSDKGFGGFDFIGISMVEDAKAPNSALKFGFAGVGGESHGKDFKIDSRVIYGVCDGEGSVPAEGHRQFTFTE